MLCKAPTIGLSANTHLQEIGIRVNYVKKDNTRNHETVISARRKACSRQTNTVGRAPRYIVLLPHFVWEQRQQQSTVVPQKLAQIYRFQKHATALCCIVFRNLQHSTFLRRVSWPPVERALSGLESGQCTTVGGLDMHRTPQNKRIHPPIVVRTEINVHFEGYFQVVRKLRVGFWAGFSDISSHLFEGMFVRYSKQKDDDDDYHHHYHHEEEDKRNQKN